MEAPYTVDEMLNCFVSRITNAASPTSWTRLESVAKDVVPANFAGEARKGAGAGDGRDGVQPALSEPGPRGRGPSLDLLQRLSKLDSGKGYVAQVQQGSLPGGDAYHDQQGNDEHFHVEDASPWGDDDEGTGTRDSRGRNLPFGVTVVRTSSPNLLSTSSSLERSFSTYCVLCQF